MYTIVVMRTGPKTNRLAILLVFALSFQHVSLICACSRETVCENKVTLAQTCCETCPDEVWQSDDQDARSKPLDCSLQHDHFCFDSPGLVSINENSHDRIRIWMIGLANHSVDSGQFNLAERQMCSPLYESDLRMIEFGSLRAHLQLFLL